MSASAAGLTAHTLQMGVVLVHHGQANILESEMHSC